MADRNLQQRSIRYPSQLFIEENGTFVSCTAVNVTRIGVCLELASEVEDMPSTFDFSMDDFRTLRTCTLVWRRGTHVGAAFNDMTEGSEARQRCPGLIDVK
jgi:hypothetical protein